VRKRNLISKGNPERRPCSNRTRKPSKKRRKRLRKKIEKRKKKPLRPREEGRDANDSKCRVEEGRAQKNEKVLAAGGKKRLGKGKKSSAKKVSEKIMGPSEWKKDLD